MTAATQVAKPDPMFAVIAVLVAAYVVVVLAVCIQVGRDIDGSRGFVLALLLGPLGLLISVLLQLSAQIGADLQRLEESIDHLDRSMSSLMPWGRPRPKRPPE